jgi:hypothetical protein
MGIDQNYDSLVIVYNLTSISAQIVGLAGCETVNFRKGLSLLTSLQPEHNTFWQ